MVTRTTARVGKVDFEIATLQSAADRIIDAAAAHEAISIRLSNAYCVALASKDENYAEVLRQPGLNYPDGTPVVWAMRAKVSGTIRPMRVRGPSLFKHTLDVSRPRSTRHYLLGTTSETLVKLRNVVEQTYPGVVISGHYAPPFSDVSDEFLANCARKILATDAQLIWIALGTPKQDYLAAALANQVGLPCVAVGAAFDFTAGTAREAPVWIQNSGLEWAYRLSTEPKRLWRRYLIGNIRFIYSALAESRSSDNR